MRQKGSASGSASRQQAWELLNGKGASKHVLANRNKENAQLIVQETDQLHVVYKGKRRRYDVALSGNAPFALETNGEKIATHSLAESESRPQIVSGERRCRRIAPSANGPVTSACSSSKTGIQVPPSLAESAKEEHTPGNSGSATWNGTLAAFESTHSSVGLRMAASGLKPLSPVPLKRINAGPLRLGCLCRPMITLVLLSVGLETSGR
jgi:hypothetical protein